MRRSSYLTRSAFALSAATLLTLTGLVSLPPHAPPARMSQAPPTPPGCSELLTESWLGEFLWPGQPGDPECRVYEQLTIHPETTVTFTNHSGLRLLYGTRLEAIGSRDGYEIRLVGAEGSRSWIHICRDCYTLFQGPVNQARIERVDLDNMDVSVFGGKVDLEGNRFRDSTLDYYVQELIGLAATGETRHRSPLTMTLRGNVFERSQVSLSGFGDPAPWHGYSVRDNCFDADSSLQLLPVGLDPADLPEGLDFRNNWWGHESGPRNVHNPDGQGASVNLPAAELYSPWLRSPPRDCRALESFAAEYEQSPIDPGARTVAVLTFRDESGVALANEEITLALDPPSEDSGTLDRATARTDSQGVVQVVYQAPEDPQAGVIAPELVSDQHPSSSPAGLAQSPGPLCRDRLPRLVARITRLNQERSTPAPLACIVQGFVKIDPDEQHGPAHVAAAEIELLQGGSLITSTFLGAHPDAAAYPDKAWTRAYFQLPVPGDFDLSRSYDLRLRLRDEDGLVAVHASPTDTLPITATWHSAPDDDPRRIWQRRELTVRETVFANPRFPALDPTTDLDLLGAGLFNYWHLWYPMHDYWPTVQHSLLLNRGVELPDLGLNLPLEVFLDEDRRRSNTYYCPTQSPPVCPRASAIHLGREDTRSEFRFVLHHELGHHLMYELYGGWPLPKPPTQGPLHERNHDGYANSSSNDSLIEGFAQFFSLALNRRLYGARLGSPIFRWASGAASSYEVNGQAWSFRRADRPPPAKPLASTEDNAVTSLLWDLIDDHSDNERSNETHYTFGGTIHTPRDEVTLSLGLVIEAIHGAKPASVRAFYQSMRDRLPAELTDPAMGRGNGLSRLDEVFVMHRFFHDDNGSWSFDHGEEVGRPAHGADWHGWLHDDNDMLLEVDYGPRNWRESMPETPGSFITLELVDQDGRPIGGILEIEVDLGPERDDLDYRYTMPIPAQPGPVRVQVEMPPAHYPNAGATFALAGSTSPPLILSNGDYWAHIPSESPLATHRFVRPRYAAIALPMALADGAPQFARPRPPDTPTSLPPPATTTRTARPTAAASPTPNPTATVATVAPPSASPTPSASAIPTSTPDPTGSPTPLAASVTPSATAPLATVTLSPTAPPPVLPPVPTATTAPVAGPRLQEALLTDETGRPKMAFASFEMIKFYVQVELPEGAPNERIALSFVTTRPDGTRLDELSWSGTHELKAETPLLSLTRALPSDQPIGEYHVVARVTARGQAQEATALFFLGHGLQLFDDFDDPSSGWTKGAAEGGSYGYLEGAYQILVDDPNRRLWTSPPGTTLGDFVLEASMSRAAEVAGSQGLVFARDAERTQYMVLQIDDRGRYRLTRYTNSGGNETLIPWTFHPAIRTGTGWNYLLAVREGTRLSLYANWHRLARIDEPRMPDEGRSGLAGATFPEMGGADHRFGHFRLYRIVR